MEELSQKPPNGAAWNMLESSRKRTGQGENADKEGKEETKMALTWQST